MRIRTFLLVLLAAAPAAHPAHPVHAQRPAAPAPTDTAGAFLDTHAASLMQRARQARQSNDSTLRSYTAIARSRSAAGLRMPMKDRTLFRSETASRIRWSRDGDNIVQVLAGRQQTPGGVEADWDGLGTRPFDPRQDRLYFGLMRDSARAGRDDSDDDDFYIEHPLGAHAERHYRYRSGDTITIRLQDGRALRVAELLVIPRRNDPQTVRGTLWIETGSAAVVRAAFRLARKVDILRDTDAADDDDFRKVSRIPLINPMEFDLTLLTIEYSLWDMAHWLPRMMRIDGVGRAGIFVAPASFEVTYQMLDVTTDRDDVQQSEDELVAATLAEWRAESDQQIRTRGRHTGRGHLLVPRDRQRLLESEMLPPPIWRDAPGFATESELRQIYDRIAAVEGPARPDLPIRFGWGRGEPGMIRYNRVEALSVGARLTVPLPHVTLAATTRLGLGDLHPNVELLALRETMRRTLELRAYHQLATVDDTRRALGAGNSLSAALLGRDEGEYFRTTGASLTLAPPSARRRTWELRGYAELHDAVERNTHIALPRVWNDSVFRPNIAADEATQYGAALHYKPWWGTDPMAAQFGIDVAVQAEAGDYEHARGRVTLRAAAPLTRGIRVGAEAGVGTTGGDVPVQRLFFLGGASSLRGYDASTLVGTSMARGRLELARAHGWGNTAIFSDWAWAGDRDDIDLARARWSLGVGFSVLDGVIRFDLARGMREPKGWRIDLHLDSVL